MPRLEVESVADMKILFEIGALTPDMSLQLSHIMMGEDIENKRRRIQLERGRGRDQGSGFLGGAGAAGKVGLADIQAAKGDKFDKGDKADKSGKDEDKPKDPKKHPPPLGGAKK